MSILDTARVATLIAVASIVIIIIGYIVDDIELQDALVSLGAVLGGAGVLGIARAQSGHGNS